MFRIVLRYVVNSTVIYPFIVPQSHQQEKKEKIQSKSDNEAGLASICRKHKDIDWNFHCINCDSDKNIERQIWYAWQHPIQNCSNSIENDQRSQSQRDSLILCAKWIRFYLIVLDLYNRYLMPLLFLIAVCCSFYVCWLTLRWVFLFEGFRLLMLWWHVIIWWKKQDCPLAEE